MDLSKIATKPQLIKRTLNDEDIIKEFGEPLDFYTWDRTPIDQFMKLASVDKRQLFICSGCCDVFDNGQRRQTHYNQRHFTAQQCADESDHTGG
jgi:hypothetical protein